MEAQPESRKEEVVKDVKERSSLRDLATLATVFAGLALPGFGRESADASTEPARPAAVARDITGLDGSIASLQAHSLRESVLKAAPDFTLNDLDGRSVSLKDTLERNEGKVVLLKFGASWCGPCRASTDQLKELHEKYAEKLVILDVNEGESRDTARRYAESHGTKYATLLDSRQQVGASYNVRGLPTFVLVKIVDGEMQSVFRQEGYSSSESAKKQFAESIVEHFHPDKDR